MNCCVTKCIYLLTDAQKLSDMREGSKLACEMLLWIIDLISEKKYSIIFHAST